MAINYIVNDPLAQVPPMVSQRNPRQPPGNGQAGFEFGSTFPEDTYAIDTPEFLFWQCREATLAALDAWGLVAPPIPRWQGQRLTLPVHHGAGEGLNAQYDRRGLLFYESNVGGKSVRTGASADAVAHEVGHALLDALRPDLWDSVYTEAAAFHEAFADCFALLVGFFDDQTRHVLLNQGSKLRTSNFLEAIAEEVADGILRQNGADHPQSKPRRALNTLQWRLPTLIFGAGPPDVLTSEPHNFSRIFSGCFYDSICNIFDLQASKDGQALKLAAEIAGGLLVAAASAAPECARFFQAVGRAMVLEDHRQNGGRYHDQIGKAFAAHGIALGSSAMLAVTSALEGLAPSFDSGNKDLLSEKTRSSLLKRIRAPRSSLLRFRFTPIGDKPVATALHRRDVSLASVDPVLKGVVGKAIESVLLGSLEDRAIILGSLPRLEDTLDEAKHFARTLLSQGLLRPAGFKDRKQSRRHTHAVRTRNGQKTLTRVRFLCGCPSGRFTEFL